MNRKLPYVAPTRPIKNKGKLSIILLSANINYKMKSYGAQSLLLLKEETLIEHQINLLTEADPSAEIIVVVGHEADKVIKSLPPNVRIVENQLYEDTNEIEQVRLALNNMQTNRALIIFGGLFFDRRFLSDIVPNTQSYLAYSDREEKNENVGVTVVNDMATILAFGLENKWNHVVHMVDKDLEILKNICSNRSRSRMYLFEGINLFLKKKKLSAIKTQGQSIKIENSRDLNRIKEVL